MTSLFIAISSHSYKLASWFIEKSPEAITGHYKEGERGGKNILHMIALEFYNYEENILASLIKYNKIKLQTLANEEDDTGYSPFLFYF